MEDSFEYHFKIPMHIIDISRNINGSNKFQCNYAKTKIKSVPCIVSRKNLGSTKEPNYSYFPVTISVNSNDLLIYDSRKNKQALIDAIIDYLGKDLNKDKENILLYAIDVSDCVSKNYMRYNDPEVQKLLNSVKGTDTAQKSKDSNNFGMDNSLDEIQDNKQTIFKLLGIPKNK